ncbi:MFS general substrate transporter [Athelia psychrophila]|uniref:MFS general substrate transporter n=1 Tax=Athelia psychrophila TaxID=1759441 RepID=A0A166UET7_9AGAM|nr:MFS general substrate transporter [Fibularhizoctonia sp. CBS 109695]
MWIQAVAIILPRVQKHYAVPDSYIGSLSSSMFAGMMFGAVGWGTCSDLMGRSAAFNATLFFTSVFGITASFATSFPSLCVLLFFLGSAVGGSMPTDGTLLLEHMPQGKTYLVTALSVFFSFGAVVSALVGIIVIPRNSCTALDTTCNVDEDNKGWQYMLMILGTITLSMFLARMVFFRLHESPRFLVHAGRAQEAIVSLKMISKFNGSELDIDIEDVDDSPPPPCDGGASSQPVLSESPVEARAGTLAGGAETIFDADARAPRHPRETSTDFLQSSSDERHYDSTGESPNSLEGQGHTLVTPVTESGPTFGHGLMARPVVYTNLTPSVPEFKNAISGHVPTLSIAGESAPSPRTPRPTRPRPLSTRSRRSRTGSSAGLSRRGSVYEVKQKVGGVLPGWIRRPLWAWLDRMAMVLAPQWRRTTVLVWIVWFGVSMAFTMFNVFLPKLLESSASSSMPKRDETETAKSLESTLWDVVIFTLGGCPGPIVGAYLVNTRLGRRGSLAWSTFVTAFFCIVFVMVKDPLFVRASTVGISLCATTMYAVLYGWTPEIFGTKVRGTACGIASALSRVGGMIAPLMGGMLLMIDRSFPVYTSAGVFVLAGACVLMLQEDAGDGKRSAGGGGAVMH